MHDIYEISCHVINKIIPTGIETKTKLFVCRFADLYQPFVCYQQTQTSHNFLSCSNLVYCTKNTQGNLSLSLSVYEWFTSLRQSPLVLDSQKRSAKSSTHKNRLRSMELLYGFDFLHKTFFMTHDSGQQTRFNGSEITGEFSRICAKVLVKWSLMHKATREARLKIGFQIGLDSVFSLLTLSRDLHNVMLEHCFGGWAFRKSLRRGFDFRSFDGEFCTEEIVSSITWLYES